MKLTLPILVLISQVASTVSAQIPNLTSNKNSYQPGDVIVKQQVEYKDPGCSGRDVIWDYSLLTPVNEQYKIRYLYRTRQDKSIFTINEHNTNYLYKHERDTLWLCGYNNRTISMIFNKPEAQLKFPFFYGDSLYSEFEGSGTYCQTLDVNAKGVTYSTIDAVGKLILPQQYTLDNVIRVHRERMYSDVGIDSALLNLETFSWYVDGLRYPVFETFVSTIIKADSVYENFKTSFYYPLDEIEKNSVNDVNKSETEQIFTEAKLLPNPVINNLSISYKLTRQAQIWFSVHDNGGVLVQKTPPQSMIEGYHEISILMSGLNSGTYTVYIHVDNIVIKRVVIKM